MSQSKLLAGAAWLVLGCAGSVTQDPSRGSTTAPEALDEKDFAKPWIVMPVPADENLGQLESLVSGEGAFVALYRKSLGSGKESFGFESTLVRSADGVTWTHETLEVPAPSAYYRSLAFGGGRYVLAGAMGGGPDAGLVSRSDDGVSWTVVDAPVQALLAVRYLHDAFYAMTLMTSLWQSPDGVRWMEIPTDTVQLTDGAFGAGRYVIAGSGPFQVSSDGHGFHPVPVDCSMTDACITDPSGGVHQGYRSRVFHGGDAFYSDSFTSEDGESWTVIADASAVPDGFWGGYLMRREDASLVLWKAGAAGARHTVTTTTENPDRLSCADHRCFVLGKELLCVP